MNASLPRIHMAECAEQDSRDLVEGWFETDEARRLAATFVILEQAYDELSGVGGNYALLDQIGDEMESLETALGNERWDAIQSACSRVDPEGETTISDDYDDRAPSVDTVLEQARNQRGEGLTVVSSDPLFGRVK